MAGDGFDEVTQTFILWFTSPDRQNAGTHLGPDPSASSQPASASAERCVAIVDKRAEGRGRAVVALRDIEPETTLFTVNHSDILSISTSRVRDIIEPSQASSLPPWIACVLTLIFEHGRGAEGKWWPYLSILPATFDTLMHWDADELRELQGSHVIHKIGREGAEAVVEAQLWPIVRAHAEKFGSHAATFSDPDEKRALSELFRLAHRFASLVMAYAFDLDQDDDEQDADKSMDEDGFVEETAPPKGMIPFADMLNAEGEELNNARLFHGERSVSMVSIKPIKAGSEVFNDYGSLPNAEVLRCYGYVASAYAQHDVVEIELDTLTEVTEAKFGFNDKQIQKRLDLAERWDVIDESFDLARDPGEDRPVDDALLITLLILTSEDDEFKELRQAKRLPKAQMSGKVAAILSQAVTRRQTEYATTIARDKALLHGDSPPAILPLRQRMAIQVRLGEKEVLAQNLEYLRGWIDTSMSEPAKKIGSDAKKARR